MRAVPCNAHVRCGAVRRGAAGAAGAACVHSCAHTCVRAKQLLQGNGRSAIDLREIREQQAWAKV